MKQREEKRKNNDNNRSSRSWCLTFIHWLSLARCCCCFNCFYIVLNVFGILEAIFSNGLNEVIQTNLVLIQTFLMFIQTFLMFIQTNLVPLYVRDIRKRTNLMLYICSYLIKTDKFNALCRHVLKVSEKMLLSLELLCLEM